MQVRAKMECGSKVTDEHGNTLVSLFAVYANKDGSRADENKAFSDATPSGSVNLMISPGMPAADLYQPGKHYYVDFTAVEEEQPAE